eukprot:TRINITY_DN79063_c0_g1_i1.p1 TRINITY_DN79063_c0_g1~~TRINITY_DN79063_c0_g1_i1.p1  ORF type:complete len:369 (+),score=88.56 TRINITY_DN79063_c0_g1_i1:85-1191(+)
MVRFSGSVLLRFVGGSLAFWAFSNIAFVLQPLQGSHVKSPLVPQHAVMQAAYAPRAALGGFESTSSFRQPVVLAGAAALLCAAIAGSAEQKESRRKTGLVACQAGSILDTFGASKKDDDEQANEMAKDAFTVQQVPMMEVEEREFTEEDLATFTGQMKEEDATELARRGEKQQSYNLGPSRQYVSWVAKKNAIRTWSKGPDGRNCGGLEVQVAILTEQIRNSVLHVRENKHDSKSRIQLTRLVARRRRTLDKLSWKDMDSYLEIRKALKIRHMYRMEALIGRADAEKYTSKDRPGAPGRKAVMRMKKAKKFLTSRLATQLRRGAKHALIHKTQSKIRSRQWVSLAYDDVKNMLADRPTTEYNDPLDLP